MRFRRKVIVVVEPSEKIRGLENDLKEAQKEVYAQKQKYRTLETKWKNEVILNIELCDLLKSHGISYRRYLDYRERLKNV